MTSHVYKGATESGLPAGTICTLPRGIKHKKLILYGDCTVKFLSIFDMMKEGTSQNLSNFYFHNYWIYVEIMTQNVNFPIMTCAVLCLPKILKECTRSHLL